jgi:aryl-alcohol dehydrogenase-like predicted oxidoreductase
MEQPQYHLLHRQRVEREDAPLCEEIGLGLTTWSPLASGLLTGKYKSGVPAGSRGAMTSMAFLKDGLTNRERNAAVAALEPIAAELGGTTAQLAIAWVAKYPHVSSVITGASNLDQLRSNLGALPLIEKLTPPVLERIDEVTAALAS